MQHFPFRMDNDAKRTHTQLAYDLHKGALEHIDAIDPILEAAQTYRESCKRSLRHTYTHTKLKKEPKTYEKHVNGTVIYIYIYIYIYILHTPKTFDILNAVYYAHNEVVAICSVVTRLI